MTKRSIAARYAAFGATVLVLLGLDKLARLAFGWHRSTWQECVVGAMYGAVACLVGAHFENRAKARLKDEPS